MADAPKVRIHLRAMHTTSDIEIGLPSVNRRYRVDAIALAEQVFGADITCTDLATMTGALLPKLSDSEFKFRQEWLEKGWEDSLAVEVST